MTDIDLLVVVGSVRKRRKAEQILFRVKEQSKDIDRVVIADFAQKNNALPFFYEEQPPMSATDDYELLIVKGWQEVVRSSKKILFITPEYNSSIPAVLKNAIDWEYHGWTHKDIAIISYGVYGGSEAYKHLTKIFERHFIPNSISGLKIRLSSIGKSDESIGLLIKELMNK